MLIDDLDPPKKQPDLVLRKLDTLSVAALNDYILELETEITRAREEIKKRGSARDKAESLFKPKSDD